MPVKRPKANRMTTGYYRLAINICFQSGMRFADCNRGKGATAARLML
jgi:hypothetical protein